ncbi:hypothetical protein [Pleurocapsa sp. PCC 7327]|uniref:hypothetical protein n=1 Tax=Pleurocapsa sp. PCC 7327 TaxID=118163 RepID=UPI0002F2EA62|nr:hypothetical protein [Pleurocapsa sp. PCC 7327]
MNNLANVEEKIVGVLRDVVEDSDLTFENLRELGFLEIVVEAIDALTKLSEADYETYLSRVMPNPIALKVKIADMKDNMDLDRILYPTEQDYQRLEQYQMILPQLLTVLAKLSRATIH